MKACFIFSVIGTITGAGLRNLDKAGILYELYFDIIRGGRDAQS
jgi:hypothetical protein